MANVMVSIGRAADIVGVTPATLRTWERDGLIASTRTCGGHRRYSINDLEHLKAVVMDDEDDWVAVCPECGGLLDEFEVDGGDWYVCPTCEGPALKDGEVLYEDETDEV